MLSAPLILKASAHIPTRLETLLPLKTLVEAITPAQVYLNEEPSHSPVCAPVVKDGNYIGTLQYEVAVSSGSMGEADMARWLLLNGPISVGIDSVGMEHYSGGIDMGQVRCFVGPGLRRGHNESGRRKTTFVVYTCT